MSYKATRRTKIESSSSSQLADSLKQPRRDFFASLVNSLFNALPDGELYGFLYSIADRSMFGRNGYGKKSTERCRKGKTGICC